MDRPECRYPDLDTNCLPLLPSGLGSYLLQSSDLFGPRPPHLAHVILLSPRPRQGRPNLPLSLGRGHRERLRQSSFLSCGPWGCIPTVQTLGKEDLGGRVLSQSSDYLRFSHLGTVRIRRALCLTARLSITDQNADMEVDGLE